MRRSFLGLFVAIIVGFPFAMAAAGETLYISSMKANLYSEPNSGSAKLVALSMGAEVQVVSQQDSWLKVATAGKTGWVQKLFTNKNKPNGKVSLLGSANSNARIHARERASSEVTAASARGLVATSKNAQGRMRGSDVSDSVAQAELSNMETISISERELMQFLKEGGM